MRALVTILVAMAAGVTAAGLTAFGPGTAAAPDSEPFKLGVFERQGRSVLGLVLRDSVVVELDAANSSLEQERTDWTRIDVPDDMKTLIAAYENGLAVRLRAIADEVSRLLAAGGARPPYVHDLASLRVRPPVYPGALLNAAVNYEEHGAEMAQPSTASTPAPAPARAPNPIPGVWERRPDDGRHNPYLFLKPASAVIGDGDAIRIPPGRDRIDWECEFTVVVGKPARRVPIERAPEHIFGYTLLNDVSDRGGRGDGRHGSDWLLGKGHDTFAPLGPFIVPREFVADPQKLPLRFTLSGTLMQDSSTDRMTHTVFELLHYASNIMTLQPGDVIATGSPAGVGSARTPPIFMRPGDIAVCSVEGIGTLTNPVVAEEETSSF